MALERILSMILNPVLDRLGTGWKSALGLLTMAGLLIANLLGYLPDAQYDTWFPAAEILFGVGMIHKVSRDLPKPSP